MLAAALLALWLGGLVFLRLMRAARPYSTRLPWWKRYGDAGGEFGFLLAYNSQLCEHHRFLSIICVLPNDHERRAQRVDAHGA